MTDITVLLKVYIIIYIHEVRVLVGCIIDMD